MGAHRSRTSIVAMKSSFQLNRVGFIGRWSASRSGRSPDNCTPFRKCIEISIWSDVRQRHRSCIRFRSALGNHDRPFAWIALERAAFRLDDAGLSGRSPCRSCTLSAHCIIVPGFSWATLMRLAAKRPSVVPGGWDVHQVIVAAAREWNASAWLRAHDALKPFATASDRMHRRPLAECPALRSRFQRAVRASHMQLHHVRGSSVW